VCVEVLFYLIAIDRVVYVEKRDGEDDDDFEEDVLALVASKQSDTYRLPRWYRKKYDTLSIERTNNERRSDPQ